MYLIPNMYIYKGGIFNAPGTLFTFISGEYKIANVNPQFAMEAVGVAHISTREVKFYDR